MIASGDLPIHFHFPPSELEIKLISSFLGNPFREFMAGSCDARAGFAFPLGMNACTTIPRSTLAKSPVRAMYHETIEKNYR